MEYRLDFISTILPTGMYSVGYVVFISVILSKIPTVSGWTFNQMLILFAVEQFFYYSGWIFYRSSIDNLPGLIRNGTFDMVSKLPINTRFVVSFREQSLDVILPFLGAIGVLIYATGGIQISFLQVTAFISTIILGMILLYNLLFALASFSFWITDADEFVGLVDEILSFGRYPQTIFPSFVGLFLLTIIPAVLMVYFPATVLLGIADVKYLGLLIFMVIVSWLVSESIWHAGLRHYTSASS